MGRVRDSERLRVRLPPTCRHRLQHILNESRFKTVLAIPVTTNLTRELYQGNVRLPANKATGLSKASVAVVSLVNNTDRSRLLHRAGRVPDALMNDIDRGLRLVFAL